MGFIKTAFFLIWSLALLAAPSIYAQTAARLEGGFVSVINHNYQDGRDASRVDMRNDVGQEILFPYYRFVVAFALSEASEVEATYVPLFLSTQTKLQRDIVVGDTTFAAGEAVDVDYDFPFYRLGYFRRYADTANQINYRFGGALQLRNASIRFSSADGQKRAVSQDVGPVPLLGFAVTKRIDSVTFGFDWQGIYAPVSYLNGSDKEIVGSFHDIGLHLVADSDLGSSAGMTLRYIGGGARGSQDPAVPASYSSNWIDLLAVSVTWQKAI